MCEAVHLQAPLTSLCFLSIHSWWRWTPPGTHLPKPLEAISTFPHTHTHFQHIPGMPTLSFVPFPYPISISLFLSFSPPPLPPSLSLCVAMPSVVDTQLYVCLSCHNTRWQKQQHTPQLTHSSQASPCSLVKSLVCSYYDQQELTGLCNISHWLLQSRGRHFGVKPPPAFLMATVSKRSASLWKRNQFKRLAHQSIRSLGVS